MRLHIMSVSLTRWCMYYTYQLLFLFLFIFVRNLTKKKEEVRHLFQF